MYIPVSDRMKVDEFNMMMNIIEDILYCADKKCREEGVGYARFCKNIHIKPNTLDRLQNGDGYTRKRDEP